MQTDVKQVLSAFFAEETRQQRYLLEIICNPSVYVKKKSVYIHTFTLPLCSFVVDKQVRLASVMQGSKA